MDNLTPFEITDYSVGMAASQFANPRNNNDINMGLLLQLQTTIDLRSMLNIYAMEAAKYVKFEGLTVLFDDQSYRVKGSRSGKFENNFNITIDGNTIAHLVYSTTYALTNSLESKLVSLHQLLRFSLRNAIEHFRLKHSSLKDHLTGLGNRGYFDEMTLGFSNRAARGNFNFTLLLLDLDNFKQVNDNYGHEEGDLVLKAFSSLAADCIRDSDIAFRFGGDEFALLLSDSDMQSANFVANRLAHMVQHNILLQRHKVTASMGSATWKQGDDGKSLFSRADKALYLAKNSGRNCYKTA